MKNHFQSSIHYGGYIYGFDNAILKCISAHTGEEGWKQSGFGKASLILADGHLIVLSERGRLALVEATPEEYREKSTLQVLQGKCWTMPALAGGKLYLRNQKEMVCLDIAEKADKLLAQSCRLQFRSNAPAKEDSSMKLLLFLILYAIALSVGLGRSGLRSRTASLSGAAGRRPTRLLIIGATGGTGRQLVLQALERGYAVTAFVRNPSKLSMEHSQLQIIQGDVLDFASVEAAVRGQDAVVCALGHKRFFYPTRVLSEGTRNLLRAMESQGVPRLVCETSLGIGDSAGRMGLYYTLFVIPVVLAFYFWDKTRQERLIAASKLDWVIVRPGMLTDAEKRNAYRHGRMVGSFIWTVRISRADVADFMLNQVSGDTYLRSSAGVCW